MKYFALFVILCVCCLGCDQTPQERTYEQIVIEAPAQNSSMMMDPHAGMNMAQSMGDLSSNSDLTWTVPEGWEEVAGGGMRVVSFKEASNPQAIDVSIVSLAGAAGGLESNLIRWAGQLGLNLTSGSNELKQLLSNAQVLKTNEGLDVKIFDFSLLQNKEDLSASSMLASMVEINGSTVFVKMTGSIQEIQNNQSNFMALTKSLGNK